MKRVFTLATVACWLFAIAVARADDYYWKSPVSGSGGTAANWSPTGVPGPTDTAIFDLGSAGYTVSPGQAQFGQLKIDNDTVTATSSLIYAVETNLPAIQLGNTAGDVAKLTLTDRVMTLGNQIWIGAQPDTQGTITVNDATLRDSTLQPANSATQIVVGAGGTGTLAVLDGTVQEVGTTIVARDAMSHGTFTVDSSHSLYQSLGSGLTVGKGGDGSLALTQAAHADVAGDFMVGQDAGSQGSVSVAGQSILTSPGFGSFNMTSATIGAAGAGSLTVMTSGKAYLAGPLVIGQDQGSQGTVLVDGSQSILAPPGGGMPPHLSLTVGAAGHGEMSVLHGASASLGGTIVVGSSASGNGHLTVDGPGSLLESAGVGGESVDKLIVGETGTGTLSVTGGGVVDLSHGGLGDVIVAQNTGSHGTLEVAGGDSKLMANNLDIATAGTGLLTISNGGKVQSFFGQVDNHAGGTIHLQGGTLDAFIGNVTVDNAGVLVNNGTVTGDVNNQLGGVVSGSGMISGVLTDLGGTLAPGNSPGSLVVGSLNFQAGTFQLEMNYASGTAGGPYGWDLLNCQGVAALSGPMMLDVVSLGLMNQPGDVFHFDPSQNYQWVFLNAAGGISGFDPADFSIDLSHFSNPYSGHFFVTQVGDTLALNYAVPEPTTWIMLAMGLAAVARRRNGRVRRSS